MESAVPIFMVERSYAEGTGTSLETVNGINRINAQEGVRWLYSLLSADKRKTYCLYEAPSPEAIKTAAARAGLPADVIVEVTGRHARRRNGQDLKLRPAVRVGGVHRRLRTVRGTGLEQDATNMIGRRVGADVEPFRDRPVAQSCGQQPQHFDLALCKSVRARLVSNEFTKIENSVWPIGAAILRASG